MIHQSARRLNSIHQSARKLKSIHQKVDSHPGRSKLLLNSCFADLPKSVEFGHLYRMLPGPVRSECLEERAVRQI
jgi:hypothetical protein